MTTTEADLDSLHGAEADKPLPLVWIVGILLLSTVIIYSVYQIGWPFLSGLATSWSLATFALRLGPALAFGGLSVWILTTAYRDRKRPYPVKFRVDDAGVHLQYSDGLTNSILWIEPEFRVFTLRGELRGMPVIWVTISTQSWNQSSAAIPLGSYEALVREARSRGLSIDPNEPGRGLYRGVSSGSIYRAA